MWTYAQSSGKLWDGKGQHIATGYSGADEGKNNPKLEALRNIGPIPKGMYVITDVYDSDSIGPLVIALEPHLHNCLGRTFFRIHGDSRTNPGEASKGCIILSRAIRERIADSNDRLLQVNE